MAKGFYTARWQGDGEHSGGQRRKHNGRFRKLPHRGRLKIKNIHDLRMLEWTFTTRGGFMHFRKRMLAYGMDDKAILVEYLFHAMRVK